MLAPRPPALLIKVSKIPVPASEPPPWITSVPFAGPYSGSCARAPPARSAAKKARLSFVDLEMVIVFLSWRAAPACATSWQRHRFGACQVDRVEQEFESSMGLAAKSDLGTKQVYLTLAHVGFDPPSCFVQLLLSPSPSAAQWFD